MRYVYLEKRDLGKFIEELGKKYRVVAPVKKENQFVFADVCNAENVTLEYLPTILPPKKYFFPQKEKLGSFNMGDIKMSETSVEVQPTLIFGAHTCDIEGLECLDAVFHADPADPYYVKRKKSIVVFGIECNKACDEHASCISMDTHVPKAGYDAMLTDAGDKYIIHVNSDIGEKLVGTSSLVKNGDETAKSELRKLRENKIKNFSNDIDIEYKDLSKVFAGSYESSVWEEVAKKCVSCGNCTAVCPTCYCFDIKDTVKLDISGGERTRNWDSCQLEEFALVAGGESFREERLSRQRHRYYRKFDYSVKKFNKYFCTGCGRCTRACVAGIKLKETLNSLKKENDNV
ncbi:MAG: 4Fe-4S dicluster domain-containing protein [Candidatus Omnitrophica bacterium]|nr:4Fe-4S dicluster domain-containing protein [Candidatus Omnitrophota bacterium]